MCVLPFFYFILFYYLVHILCVRFDQCECVCVCLSDATHFQLFFSLLTKVEMLVRCPRLNVRICRQWTRFPFTRLPMFAWSLKWIIIIIIGLPFNVSCWKCTRESGHLSSDQCNNGYNVLKHLTDNLASATEYTAHHCTDGYCWDGPFRQMFDGFH